MGGPENQRFQNISKYLLCSKKKHDFTIGVFQRYMKTVTSKGHRGWIKKENECQALKNIKKSLEREMIDAIKAIAFVQWSKTGQVCVWHQEWLWAPKSFMLGI